MDLSPETEFDLIFLDGLHEESQVLRDIHNSLTHLAPGGWIVVPDCNPPAEVYQRRDIRIPRWCGTSWKAWARLRCTRPDLEMLVIDTDRGIGLIRRGSQSTFSGQIDRFDWQFLDDNRIRLLNLVPADSFNALVENKI